VNGIAVKRRTSKHQAAMIFILITLFIDILGIGIIVPVLPELIKDFVRETMAESSSIANIDSIAGWYVGVIGASYSLMQFLCAPIMGALSDRFGRRPILLASLFGLGVDFLIQGLAPGITWLFLGRLVAGMMGASITTANAYIADISTAEDRARNFGLVGVMFGLGFIFGPALGGLLGGIHVRLPFFVSAALALANWLYGYFILPESLPMDQRSSFTWAKANPFGTMGRLKMYPIVAGLAAAFVCISLAQRGLENVWVLYTGYRFGWEERANGAALALVGLMATIVQGGLVRPVIRRFGERRTVIGGLCVSTLAFLCYGLATHPWMILTTIVFGSLGGVTGPAIQSIVTGSVSPSDQGKVQGALTSLMSLTNILAPLLFTAGLFSYFTSERAAFRLPGAPFLVGSALLAVALLIVLQVFSRSMSANPPGGRDT
jgi:DHA1 family tetracycline resistance protein-like MFS transporter